MKKKILYLGMVAFIGLFTFMPFMSVKAQISQESKRISFVLGSTENEAVSSETNMTNYIDSKKQEFENSLAEEGLGGITNATLDYNSLFSIDAGDYRYAVIRDITGPVSTTIEGNLYNVFTVTYDVVNVNNNLAGNLASLIYDGNGGSGVMTGVIKNAGDAYTLLECSFTPPRGHEFSKWWIDGIGYKNPGDVITLNGTLKAQAVWIESETERIDTLNITVKRPKIGDKVVLNDMVDEVFGYSYKEPSMIPTIGLGNNANCSVEYRAFIKSFPSMSEDYDSYFEGTFEKDKYYYVEISLFADEGYSFSDNQNMTVTINGENANYELGGWNADGSLYYLLYAKVKAIDASELSEYSLTSGDVTLSFFDEAGRNYQLMAFDVLKLSKDELMTLVNDEEEFNRDLELIKNNVGKYGNLLSVYAIEVADQDSEYTGKAKIKIKKTADTKKFNRIRLVHIDENNNFKAGEVVELTEEGDYYVGEVPHLSVYALVGDNVEKTVNPKTYDGILSIIVLLGVSLVGLGFITYKAKKIN